MKEENMATSYITIVTGVPIFVVTTTMVLASVGLGAKKTQKLGKDHSCG